MPAHILYRFHIIFYESNHENKVLCIYEIYKKDMLKTHTTEETLYSTKKSVTS